MRPKLQLLKTEGNIGGADVTARPSILMVLYANPDYYPPTFNAVGILSKHFDIRIVCRKMDPEFRRWPANVAIERLGAYASAANKQNQSTGAKLREFAMFAGAVHERIRTNRPRLIYAYDAHALSAVMWHLRKSAAPIIFHAHEVADPDRFRITSPGSWIVKFALRSINSAALTVFPDKRRAQAMLKRAQDSREPMIVPNYPARNFASEIDVERLVDRRFAERRAIYIGPVAPDNGHLEAALAIRRVDPPATLDFVGWASPSTFVSQVRAAGGDHVSTTGWLSEYEKTKRLESASLGLCLYKPVSVNWEHCATASNKIFEYAACGLPVVVPDRADFREALGREQWIEFADVNVPDSIAAAITKTLANRSRYISSSRAARRRFERALNYEIAFAPLLEKILEITGSGRDPGAQPSREPPRLAV